MTIKLLRMARRFVPQPWRQRLRRSAFRWLDLSWTRPSGITLRVDNYNEWIIELHEKLCPIDRCPELLRDVGFTREIVLRRRSDCALVAFARESQRS